MSAILSGIRSGVASSRLQLALHSGRACRIGVFLLLAVVLRTHLDAQKAVSRRSTPTATYKLLELKVTGTQRFTEKEILPATGLELGQSVGESDFKEAVKLLGDSGLFTDIAYSYSYSSDGTKLELRLTDADSNTLVPAHFENFVWFSDADLQRELQKRVPLFKGDVPIGGSMPDRLEAALQALLDERQIPARVDYLRESPPSGDKLIGIAYSVEAMDVRIRNVEFPGATDDLLPGLQVAARRLAGAPYRRSALVQVAEVDFLPICLKRGYLKGSFSSAEARVVSQSGQDVEVDAIIPVTPGKVYATSAVDWKGNSVIKSDELHKLLHLSPGQPADAIQLDEDLRAAVKLYHSRGYMTAQVKPKSSLDDDKSTVQYELLVTEGDQFKMGELEILGLDSQAKAQLRGSWKLEEGAPYNGDYVKQFLDQTKQMLPRGVSWSVTYHEAVNEQDNTVDVAIRFIVR